MPLRTDLVPWAEQPQEAVEGAADFSPDWLVNFAAGSFNQITGPTTITDIGTVGTAASAGGRLGGVRGILGASASRAINDPRISLVTAGEVCHLFVAKITSLDASYGGIFAASDIANSSAFSIQRDASTGNLQIFRGNGGGTILSGAVASIVDSKAHAFLVYSQTNGANSATELWIDGVLAFSNATGTSGGSTPSGTTSRAIYFSERTGSVTFGSDGEFYAHACWRRNLPAALKSELTANPWQLFAPRVQRIWAPVASGPVTHATDGALVGAGSVAVGAAARFRALSTSGALTGQIGSVAGSAARAGGAVSHDNTGALIGGASVISGSAARVAGFVTHATSGDLAGAGASLAGTAARVAGVVSHATSGDLIGGAAQIAGTAARLGLPVTHATTGALAGPGALLVGSAFPTPSLVLLGGGPGGPKKDTNKYREKGSAWERLLSPPLRERVRQLEEQEPEAIELIEAKAVAEVARPVQSQAQDGAAEIQRVMEQAGLAYQDAYREIYTELLAEMLQQQEDEAVAMAVASLV